MGNPNEDSTRRAARFGAYEADFETGELRKNGLRIKIQEKPLRLLQALIERPGELVTREELRARVWPSDVYVDFDRNLKTALNKLRTALCDSAESPRYIETLARRGYRFIAPVEMVTANHAHQTAKPLPESQDGPAGSNSASLAAIEVPSTTPCRSPLAEGRYRLAVDCGGPGLSRA